eukprot:922250-Prymnesium_polylepis.1
MCIRDRRAEHDVEPARRPDAKSLGPADRRRRGASRVPRLCGQRARRRELRHGRYLQLDGRHARSGPWAVSARGPRGDRRRLARLASDA